MAETPLHFKTIVEVASLIESRALSPVDVTEAALERISFIRHGRNLGLDLHSIQELLALSDHPDTDCSAADDIASRHLAHLEARIAKLQALADELRQVVHQCRGGKAADCQIIQTLYEHQPSCSDTRCGDSQSLLK